MKKLESRTRTEKSTRILGGLGLVILGSILGGVLALLLWIVGLSLAGNALFAKTKKD